jgi:hypothetical protein
MASKESRGQSDDEDGEEEEDGEEAEMDEEEEAREPVKEKRSAMESMYSDVINIDSKFTEMVEDTRKKELKSRKKTARQSLDFDSPPRKPAKYSHQQFTPPRQARELTKATQYEDDDCERDSLCSSQLALLVFVCRKGGELSGPKRRRLLAMNSKSGLSSMPVLKWPKPDKSKICVRRPPMLADSNVYM